MSKQSDDFRAYLGSFFDGENAPEKKVEPEPKPAQEEPETVEATVEATGLSAEELFEQGAQAARAQRHQREAEVRKEEAEEAAAWLQDSVRDESTDSSQGFDFLDEDDERDVPIPDEWPAFADMDRDTIVARYGVPTARDDGNDDGGSVSGSDGGNDSTSTDSRKTSAQKASDRERSFGRSLKRFLGGFLGALVVLALAGASAYGIWRGHTQSQQVKAPAFQGAPVSAQLACAGSFERSLETGMNVEDIDERISDTALMVATGAAHSGDTHVNAPADKDALAIAKASTASGVFSADKDSTSLGGLNFHRAEAGDMRGLAGAACLGGHIDSYLVGSEISVGTSNELVLVNLSFAPATVTLEALGSAGLLEASSIENIVVDAQSVKRVSLDGAIDGDNRLALHISSSGGAVAAFVQETVLEGAKPAGVTWISPSPAAAHLVIPAISIPLDSVDFPRVRVANFEDEPATVSLALRSESGTLEREDLSNIELAAHSVLDIPLDGIDGGTYSAVITSTNPVSAGAELVYRHSADAPREIAWASAVSPAYEAIGVFGEIPATLVVAGQEPGKATVSLYNAAGALVDTSQVDISDTRSAVVNIPATAVAVKLSADVPVSAGIYGQASLEDGGMAVDWLPLVSRGDDVGSQRISMW
ncbi:MAG: hypothetical protein IKS49_03605 [Actinomycetaceae bacterium]|nr:hypothetical protein [Actinomycetaceae bacterium]